MSQLNVDTINEQTSSNGITIDGLTIKDTMPFIIWMNISIPLFIYLGISFKTLYIFMINHLTMLYGNPSKLFRSPTTFLINFKMVS